MRSSNDSRFNPWTYALVALTVVVIGVTAAAQSVPVVTGDARVDKLLSQMTLKEKLTLIHGGRGRHVQPEGRRR